MSLLRIFALLVVTVSLTATASEAQAVGLPFPGVDDFSSIGDAAHIPLFEPNWTCSPPGASRCDCVQSTRGQAHTMFVDVNDQSDHLQSGAVVLVASGTRLMAGDFTAFADGRRTSVSLGPGIWHPSTNTAVRLRFREGSFELEDGEVISAQFHELSWEAAVTAPSAPESCDEIDTLSFERFVGETISHKGPTAESAELVDGRWIVSGLDFPGVASPRLPSRLYADDALSGFLPPTLSIFPDAARLTGTYHLARPAISLRAHADSASIAGAGIGYWSTSPLCADSACRPRPLFTDVYGGFDGFETAHLGGDFGAGEPRHHVSASIDGVAAGASDYDPGPLERLSRDAFFRPWSLHGVGASLGGDGHDLIVGTALVHEGGGSFDFTERPSHTTRLWLDYGTRLAISDAGVADVRVQHAEFDIGADDSGRLTRLSLGVDRSMGSPNRAFVRPALRADMITEVTNTAEGAEAGSRGQFDALVDGGLALRGDVGSLDHFAAPRAFVGRRLFAEDALPTRLPATRAAREALAHEGPFNFAGIALEQHLQSSRGRRLRLPLAVIVTDDGSGTDWSADSRTSLEYTAADTRPFVVGLDARCVDGCNDSSLQARLHLSWTETVETIHIAGRGAGLHPAASALDGRVRAGMSPWHTAKPAVSAGDENAFHASSVRRRWARWDAEVRLLGELQQPSNGGVEVMVERFWPQLGWGITLHAAAMGDEPRWASVLGLRNSPAF